MNWTKFSVASLLGGVSYFFLGWIIFGIALRNLTALPAEISAVVEYPPEEFRISLMIISCLIYGVFLTFVAMKWASVSTFAGGFKMAAIIGVFVTLSVGLAMSSMYKMNSIDQILINAVGEALCAGLAGGVIGWYLGR